MTGVIKVGQDERSEGGKKNKMEGERYCQEGEKANRVKHSDRRDK